MILASRPERVHVDKAPDDDERKARGWPSALREAEVQTGIWWYADHPSHYTGDARTAKSEAGARLLDAMAEMTARAARSIKADSETRPLLVEFYSAAAGPAS